MTTTGVQPGMRGDVTQTLALPCEQAGHWREQADHSSSKEDEAANNGAKETMSLGEKRSCEIDVETIAKGNKMAKAQVRSSSRVDAGDRPASCAWRAGLARCEEPAAAAACTARELAWYVCA